MLRSASRHYSASALMAQRAVREARKAAPRGLGGVARVVATHQASQARISEIAVAAMLAEQGMDAPAAGTLSLSAFTTPLSAFESMAAEAASLDRLVASLVQDAGRAAESVATTARPRVGHVRYLSPPSCSRCAVLAGAFYRYSDGFKRHPNCDCVMVPTEEDAAEGLVSDPTDLVREGRVTGLSKADLRAVNEDGADLNQVVNVRRTQAGLTESGRVLARRDRLTPEGIYSLTGDDRERAVHLLRRYGYIR